MSTKDPSRLDSFLDGVSTAPAVPGSSSSTLQLATTQSTSSPALSNEPPPALPPQLTITADRFLTFPALFKLKTVDGKGILVGPNGAGKTNVLRALRLCLDVLSANGFMDIKSSRLLQDARAGVELENLPQDVSRLLSTAVCLCLGFLLQGDEVIPPSEREGNVVVFAKQLDIAVARLSVSGFSIDVEPQYRTRLVSTVTLKCLIQQTTALDLHLDGKVDTCRAVLNGVDIPLEQAAGAVFGYSSPPASGSGSAGNHRLNTALVRCAEYSSSCQDLLDLNDFMDYSNDAPMDNLLLFVRDFLPTLFAFYPGAELGLFRPEENHTKSELLDPENIESALATIGTRSDVEGNDQKWETLRMLFSSLMSGKELAAFVDDQGNRKLQLRAPHLNLPRYSFSEASSGERNVLTVLALLFGFPQVVVVALDEPLSNLYRPLQKEAEWLIDQSSKCVLTTTHATGMLGPRTLRSVFHLGFPGVVPRPTSAEFAREQVAALYQSQAAGDMQSHRLALEPTMRELFFVNGVILVEGAADKRFLESLVAVAQSNARRLETPLVNWTVRDSGGCGNLRQASVLLTVLGVPFLVLMDGDVDDAALKEAVDGVTARIAAEQNRQEGQHWWSYFKFKGELENAIVGTDPEHTAGYLRGPPFTDSWEKWRDAQTDEEKALTHHRLAGTGNVKKSKTGLHKRWADVWFDDMVADAGQILQPESQRRAASPELSQLVGLLASPVSEITSKPLGINLNVTG